MLAVNERKTRFTVHHTGKPAAGSTNCESVTAALRSQIQKLYQGLIVLGCDEFHPLKPTTGSDMLLS